jgi:magnesium transporter
MPTASPASGVDFAAPISQVMHRDVLSFGAEQTVRDVLKHLREQPFAGRIIYFYVTDPGGRLVGVTPTRRLLLSPEGAKLGDIMIRQVVALPDSATVLDACEFFTLHRFLAFPVVDADKRLVGIVDVDLYTDELTSLETYEAQENLFQLIGVHQTEAQRRSPWASFRGRFPWLLCNVAGGLVAAVLSGLYQNVLSWNEAVLALFIPVVLALAESVSIQSVSLALDALRGRTPTWGRIATAVRQELLTGVLLGISCALLVGAAAVVWQREWGVAVCLVGGISGGVTAAALVGVALPNVLRLLRRNPNLAAGPIALAVADMATLLIYFNLARLMLI